MARILIILPEADYDPSEVALPWWVWSQSGHEVHFATPDGHPAYADPITLGGEGLPFFAATLKARLEAERAYEVMIRDSRFLKPVRWKKAAAKYYAALHFPGGHAPAMKGYCESPEVFRLAREAFASNQPVSAICHGVLPLARAGVLKGRRTTALTQIQETIAVKLTEKALPGHYQTYPITVEAEVRQRIGKAGTFERGGIFPRYSGARSPRAGFVVRDGNYLSARWPGDAWTLAVRMGELLAK